MKKNMGFTLIELLVVISIIALLLSILMPGLTLAKKKATGVVCLSNENQLSKAWFMFATDNDDKIVDGQPEYETPADGFTDYGQFGGRVANCFADPINANNTGRDFTLQGRIRGLEKGGLWEYLGTHEIYHCPGDKRSSKDELRYGYRTYSIGAVYSRGALDWAKGKGTYEGDVAVTKATQIVNPSGKFVWLEEMDVQQPYNQNTWNIYLGGPKRWWDPVAVWHGDSSTFGFADGHAERHKWRNELTLEKGDYGLALEGIERGDNQKIAKVPDGEEEDYDWVIKHYIPKRIPGDLRAKMP